MVCVLLDLKANCSLLLITIIIATTNVIIQWEVKFSIKTNPVPRNHTEHLGVVVMLWTCICEVPCSYLSRFKVYTLNDISNAFYVYFCWLFGGLVGYLVG